MLRPAALLLGVLALAAPALGKRYVEHEPIPLIVNKVGPFANPSETYAYFSLPMCRSTGRVKKHSHELGEILVGDRKVHSPYDITFLDNVPWRLLCEKSLTEAELKRFIMAIEDDYYFEMFLDELPMWGYIGEVEGEDLLLGHLEHARRYLYPHLHFSLGYNVDQIVSVNVSTHPQRKVYVPPGRRPVSTSTAPLDPAPTPPLPSTETSPTPWTTPRCRSRTLSSGCRTRTPSTTTACSDTTTRASSPARLRSTGCPSSTRSCWSCS